MRELYDFRIREDYAARLFGPQEGKTIGFGVRRIRIGSHDPKFARIGLVEETIQSEKNDYFFSSWSVVRSYTRSEMAAADLFLLSPLAYFEPAGEECGTQYEDHESCKHCGAGARQTGPLFLPVSRIPKKPDIAITIAGEIVVNDRVADLLRTHHVSGISLGAVRQKGSKDLRSLGWHKVSVQGTFAEIAPPTRTGITPFDDDDAGEYRCPNGDTIGLNLLSEVTIRASTRGDAGFMTSQQFVGRRAGVLRPRRCIFVSQTVRQLFEEHAVRGYRLEVAHIV